jgi:SAM-dependent methyltransferase
MEFVDKEIARIEQSIKSSTTRDELLRILNVLGLSDFGSLMFSMPDSRYPRISALLPRMASEDVQRSWTGVSGEVLLGQTIDFVRSAAFNFARSTGRSLDGRRILDFGCGFGRISRLMYYFTGEANLYGVDPWDKALEACRDSGLVRNFLLSDDLPLRLPVGDKKFDFIFAFSVFTHLSERATSTCLNTLAQYVNDDGLIAITIRPVEYWDVDTRARGTGVAQRQKAIHASHGFAFLPHDRPPVDGDVTYGDTSIALDWLRERFSNFEIVGIDRSLSDPYQLYVFIRRS